MFLNPYSLDLLCSAMAGRAPVVPARFPSVYYTSKHGPHVPIESSRLVPEGDLREDKEAATRTPGKELWGQRVKTTSTTAKVI